MSIITSQIESEMRRLGAMLYLAEKAKTKEDYKHLAKGFELSAQSMADSYEFCMNWEES